MMGYLVGLCAELPGFKIVHVEPTIISGLELGGGQLRVALRHRFESLAAQRRTHYDASGHPAETAAPALFCRPKPRISYFRGGRISVPPAGGRLEVLVKSGMHQFSGRIARLTSIVEKGYAASGRVPVKRGRGTFRQ